MVDKIGAELDLVLNASSAVTQTDKIASNLETIFEKITEINLSSKVLSKTLNEVAQAQAKQFLQAAAPSRNTEISAVVTNNAVAAAKANLKGEQGPAIVDLLKAQAAITQKIVGFAADNVAQSRLELKIKQGVIDLDTLAIEKKQTLYQIGLLQASGLVAQGHEAALISQELSDQYAQLVKIESKEKELLAIASQQVQREKEIQQAYTQRAQQVAKAAQEEAKQNTPQNLSRIGKDAYNDAEALRKIKANIVDLDTLAYQREQAQIEVGRLQRSSAGANATAQAAINEQLEKQYSLLRTIDQTQTQIQNHSRLNNIIATGGADLLRIQAQLIVNYGLLNAVFNTLRFSSTFVKDLDESFHQLQAIAGLTAGQMVGLKETILDVAKNSKFSAKDIADSAVVLGQAGFSGDQIRLSLKAINDLATASGSTLANAVQNVTSVLNVFNYGADQTVQVANQMTGALNLSKLSMDQVTLGIQYAANTAAEANVSFAEMLATFGALANAGIRSGSTIGTGFRKLLQDLQNPTAKFQEKVAQLGLSMEQLDIRSQGLGNVLETLQKAGFTAADAMSTLDVRAASVAIPLLRSTDAIALFEQKLYLSQAALDGTQTQMESLSNSINKLKNSFGTIIFDTFEGFVGIMAKVASTIADVFNNLGLLRVPLEGIIAGFTALAGVGLTQAFVKLIANLIGTKTAVVEATGAFTGLFRLIPGISGIVGVITSLRTAVLGFAASVGLTSPVVAALIVGLTALAFIGSKLYDAFGFGNSRLEAAKTKLADLEAETSKYQQRATQLNEFMEKLITQYDDLSKNSEQLRARTLEAANAFNTMGTQVIAAGDKIDVLIEKVAKLSAENYRAAAAAATLQLNQLGRTDNLIHVDQQTKASSALQDIRLVQSAPNLKSDTELQKILDMAENFFSNPKRTKEDADTLANAIVQAQKVEDQRGQAGLSVRNPGLLENISNLVATQVTGLKDLQSHQLDEDNLTKLVQGFTFDEANIKSVLEFLKTENPVAQQAVEFFRHSGSKVAGDIAERNLTSVTTQIDKKIAELTGQPGADNSASIIELQKKRAEVENLQLQISEQQYARQVAAAQTSDKDADLKIEQLKLTVKSGDLAQAQNATQEIINEAKVKEQNAIARATAYAESKQFIKDTFEKQGYVADKDAVAAAKQKYKDQAALDANIAFQAATAAANLSLQQRSSGGDPSLSRGVITSLTELQNSIKATITAYKAQIDAIDASTKAAEAQRAGMDLARNAPFIGDGARFLKDRENEAQAEQALRDKSAATDAYLATLDQKRIQLEAQAKKSLAQAESEAGVGTDFAGNSVGRFASKSFKLDKADTNAATKDLLNLGEEIRKAKKSQAEYNAELQKYAVIVTQNEPISKTFSDSLEQFQILSYYGAQAMSKDFAQMFADIKSGFGDVVRNFVNGTQTIGQSFKALGVKILETLENIAISKFTQSISDSLFGIPGKAGAAASPGILSQIGTFLGFASGGLVTGGTPGKDSVPSMLMPDEFVLNRQAVSTIGVDKLQSLNNGNLNVSNMSNQIVSNNGSSDGGKKTVNVYVVTPDQVPGLGPNDVVSVVSDNISRGGPLKQLIKSVVV